ncbi:UDP-N-acetylmuramoyl-L-alanyl-D-glutamate--2,6-diaminopimelate ligase [Endozoicomonas sp. G2_1]|uniref:UDP-N-acetylmuramoyl-L-alanyl-D-glutamate--2, 6-diaminopimelate ligase n=1 Tax=Endozoicomonas sp. G2_1 TaxID=2821091 RepID=UPI001AD9F8E5|nr:UDP-N-acetylmuramoyl-L-alanyl-D-glutamate--2,6-diaminopimelate ligase [Endozoicomonas sp. G2_1]MBO9491070.1 UDP-N-acetylmuramoyl-L-alanyl-D-glutamate--2,6-diaminopimelate ligase [Endozoicomonas sp. G2_1]
MSNLNRAQQSFDLQALLQVLDLSSSLAAQTLIQEHECFGQLHVDSRLVSNSDIFFAVIGHQLDGRAFIDKAVEQGARLVIAGCETEQEHGQLQTCAEVPVLSCFDLNKRLFNAAKAYYRAPQNSMLTIGITGTNGKTSVSQLIAQLFDLLGGNAAIIGTTGAGKLAQLAPVNNTTPGAIELHQLFNDFVEQNIEQVAMEVSSHALSQGRINADELDVAVFTNLSRDHLDYHGDMASYAEAKAQIFAVAGLNAERPQQVTVLNGDDSQAQSWLKQLPQLQNSLVYGRQPSVKVFSRYLYACDIEHSASGVSFTLETEFGQCQMTSALLGDFNIDNLLAAIAVVLDQQLKKLAQQEAREQQSLGRAKSAQVLAEIQEAVIKIKPVAGRMELFTDIEHAATVVDYAHTPDALANALSACRQHCQGQLIVVFGCGGNRDRGKRKEMGAIAEQFADAIVLTNDNPRNEAPEAIVSDIQGGITNLNKVSVCYDRSQAVRQTIACSNAGDIILLAGKGHETSIILGEQVLPYDERALVAELYQQSQSSQQWSDKSEVKL